MGLCTFVVDQIGAIEFLCLSLAHQGGLELTDTSGRGLILKVWRFSPRLDSRTRLLLPYMLSVDGLCSFQQLDCFIVQSALLLDLIGNVLLVLLKEFSLSTRRLRRYSFPT